MAHYQKQGSGLQGRPDPGNRSPPQQQMQLVSGNTSIRLSATRNPQIVVGDKNQAVQQSQFSRSASQVGAGVYSQHPSGSANLLQSAIINCTDLTTDDFEVMKMLGRGTFGIVRQARCRRDGKIYAIKSIPLQKKKFTYKVNQHGNLQEVEIMADLQHPNIIRMIASFTGLDFAASRSNQAQVERSLSPSKAARAMVTRGSTIEMARKDVLAGGQHAGSNVLSKSHYKQRKSSSQQWNEDSSDEEGSSLRPLILQQDGRVDRSGEGGDAMGGDSPVKGVGVVRASRFAVGGAGPGIKKRNHYNRYKSIGANQGGDDDFDGGNEPTSDKLRYSMQADSQEDLDQDQGAKKDKKRQGWEGKCIHIVLELAECGDVQKLLENQLKKRLYFSERDLWSFAWQIIMGLLHLHTRGVIHRDIKCMNLLLTDNCKTVKLGDMSESRVLDHHRYIKTKQIIGTPLSLSPEVVKQEGYDQRSDIWAMGVALYSMACLEPPFYEQTISDLFNSIVYKTPKPITTYSQKFGNFVGAMLNKKKEQRPLITDLVDYFKEKQVPLSLASSMRDLDKANYVRFKEQQVKSFNKKRMIEKNTIGINHEFSQLKNRIKAGNESFRANFLKNYGSGSGSMLGNSLVIPPSAIQKPGSLAQQAASSTAKGGAFKQAKGSRTTSNEAAVDNGAGTALLPSLYQNDYKQATNLGGGTTTTLAKQLSNRVTQSAINSGKNSSLEEFREQQQVQQNNSRVGGGLLQGANQQMTMYLAAGQTSASINHSQEIDANIYDSQVNLYNASKLQAAPNINLTTDHYSAINQSQLTSNGSNLFHYNAQSSKLNNHTGAHNQTHGSSNMSHFYKNMAALGKKHVLHSSSQISIQQQQQARLIGVKAALTSQQQKVSALHQQASEPQSSKAGQPIIAGGVPLINRNFEKQGQLASLTSLHTKGNQGSSFQRGSQASRMPASQQKSPYVTRFNVADIVVDSTSPNAAIPSFTNNHEADPQTTSNAASKDTNALLPRHLTSTQKVLPQQPKQTRASQQESGPLASADLSVFQQPSLLSQTQPLDTKSLAGAGRNILQAQKTNTQGSAQVVQDHFNLQKLPTGGTTHVIQQNMTASSLQSQTSTNQGMMQTLVAGEENGKDQENEKWTKLKEDMVAHRTQQNNTYQGLSSGLGMASGGSTVTAASIENARNSAAHPTGGVAGKNGKYSVPLRGSNIVNSGSQFQPSTQLMAAATTSLQRNLEEILQRSAGSQSHPTRSGANLLNNSQQQQGSTAARQESARDGHQVQTAPRLNEVSDSNSNMVVLAAEGKSGTPIYYKEQTVGNDDKLYDVMILIKPKNVAASASVPQEASTADYRNPAVNATVSQESQKPSQTHEPGQQETGNTKSKRRHPLPKIDQIITHDQMGLLRSIQDGQEYDGRDLSSIVARKKKNTLQAQGADNATPQGGANTSMVYRTNEREKPSHARGQGLINDLTGSKEGGFSINAFLRKQSHQQSLASDSSQRTITHMLTKMGTGQGARSIKGAGKQVTSPLRNNVGIHGSTQNSSAAVSLTDFGVVQSATHARKKSQLMPDQSHQRAMDQSQQQPLLVPRNQVTLAGGSTMATVGNVAGSGKKGSARRKITVRDLSQQ